MLLSSALAGALLREVDVTTSMFEMRVAMDNSGCGDRIYKSFAVSYGLPGVPLDQAVIDVRAGLMRRFTSVIEANLQRRGSSYGEMIDMCWISGARSKDIADALHQSMTPDNPGGRG